jgi:hypothetical protein
MAENINYQAVLADLRAKRDALNAAIGAIEEIAGIKKSPLAQKGSGMASVVPSPLETPAGPVEIHRNAFFGLKMPDAIKKYLSMAMRRETTGAIIEGLKAGGLASESKNFTSIVYTALRRLERKGEVVRIGKKWGLAEWQPGYVKKGKEESKT